MEYINILTKGCLELVHITSISIMAYGSEGVWEVCFKELGKTPLFNPELLNTKKNINSFEMWCWRIDLQVSWISSMRNTQVPNQMKPELALGAKLTSMQLYLIMKRKDSLEKRGKNRMQKGKGGIIWGGLTQ